MSVLDVSACALDRARQRLGPAGEAVRWIVSDVTGNWEAPPVDVWHDRAVFHFLTEPEERAAYVARLAAQVPRGGHAIVGTFAADGPARCSGLPVCRYSAEGLAEAFAGIGSVIERRHHVHVTPTGRTQPFTFVLLARE